MLGLRVERGKNPYPVHLFIPRPGIGDAEVQLCVSYEEAYELCKSLNRVLEDIEADGCGWQVHSP